MRHLLVEGELRLETLSCGGLAGIETVYDRLEQVLELIGGLHHRSEDVSGLDQGFVGRHCRLAPKRIEPQAIFCANSPG